MEKIALSIEQMKHLEELGVDISIKPLDGTVRLNWGEWNGKEILSTGITGSGICAAFTLQDILELLPDNLRICKDHINGNEYWVGNFMDVDWCDFNFDSSISVLDLVYNILCWCAKNGYLNK